MHAGAIVARVIGPCLTGLHAKRAEALRRAVCGLLIAGVVSLSAIALCVGGAPRLKHRIKSVDRLLGNGALRAARSAVYAALAARWLSGLRQVLLVIDWSDLTRDQRWQWLRASVVIEGRSQTLYEEVHPQSRLGHPRVHEAFLEQVGRMLPAGCTPIVMTDARFRASWFKLVAARGWEFVGRIRGRDLLLPLQGEGRQWTAARALYEHASAQARELGSASYARSNPIAVRLVLIKQAPKGRHRLSAYGKPCKGRSSARNARRSCEPWLLAASAGLDHLSAQAIVALYAQRMRIEQSFRDAKNLRFGLGLEAARSRSAQRLEMLLLVAHLASFVQRLIGEDAKGQQLELNFMSTRRAKRGEVSAMTLGRRILDAPAQWLDRLKPWRALAPLTAQAVSACAVS